MNAQLANATDEQLAIIEAIITAIISGSPNVSVIARAGVGKTYTANLALHELVRRYPNAKATAVYFNQSARQDMTARTEDIKGNVRVVTNHTIAWDFVGKDYGNAHRLHGIGDRKVKRFRAKDITGIFGVEDVKVGDHIITGDQISAMAMQAQERFAAREDEYIHPGHVRYVPALDEYMKDLRPVIVKLAREIWDDKRDKRRGILSITHDDYFKMWAELPYGRIYATDGILVDEAQDTSRLMWKVLQKHFEPYTTKAGKTHKAVPLIATGDNAQQLYAWRDAFNIGPEVPDAVTLFLTQTFRNGGAVVEYANRILSYMGEPAESWMKGREDRESLIVEGMSDPDAILGKTNSGLITAAMWCLENNRTFALHKGGKELRFLVESLIALEEGAPQEHPDLIGVEDMPMFMDLAENDPAFGEYKIMAKLIKDHGPKALLDLVTQAVPQDQADTFIATIFTQKGQEWPRVKINEDMLLKIPDEVTEGVAKYTEQDTCLAYVGVTRAEQALDLGPLKEADF